MEIGTAIIGLLSLVGGGFIAYLGGWDTSLEFLFVFMILDIITGVLVSIVFGKSHNTKSGRYSSRAFLKGIIGKILILCIVVLAFGIGSILGIDYIRDTVVLFFVFNEAMSIIENAECMGLPIPQKLRKALDVFYEEIDPHDDPDEKDDDAQSVKKV